MFDTTGLKSFVISHWLACLVPLSLPKFGSFPVILLWYWQNLRSGEWHNLIFGSACSLSQVNTPLSSHWNNASQGIPQLFSSKVGESETVAVVVLIATSSYLAETIVASEGASFSRCQSFPLKFYLRRKLTRATYNITPWSWPLYSTVP